MARSKLIHALLLTSVAGLGLSTCWAGSPATKGPAPKGVLVFGLPIGGVLKPGPKVCTTAEITSITGRSMCWLVKPTTNKDGSKLGILHMPDPDSRPEWAASAQFNAIVSKAGTLDWLNVVVKDGANKHQIADSISKRFGYPVQAPLPQNFIYATWHKEGLQIDQVCDYRQCTVKFGPEPTAEEKAKADAAYEEAARRRANRPISP